MKERYLGAVCERKKRLTHWENQRQAWRSREEEEERDDSDVKMMRSWVWVDGMWEGLTMTMAIGKQNGGLKQQNLALSSLCLRAAVCQHDWQAWLQALLSVRR